MNILVAMGSFKDVFSPIEMTTMIADALTNHDVIQMPMCDGGEYTYDVIKYHKACKEIFVTDVVNPYGKLVDSRYLAIEDTAYVISSEIIRLYPEEDKYMNPMMLTDYGLGQLCMDAIEKGYKKINLCLGGTSTVGFGMGFAQAMGAKMYDCYGNVVTKPITPELFAIIERVEKIDLGGVCVTVVNDGITTAHDLKIVNQQKIGQRYKIEKTEILSKLNDMLMRVCRKTGISIDTPFAGNGGGVLFGIECTTSGEYKNGTEYFMELFNLKENINAADLIITGEGKLDNIHVEKLPVSISKITMNMGKKCLYICGQKGTDVDEFELKKYGINEVICCSDHYSDYLNNGLDAVSMYKQLTPKVIGKELEKMYGIM